jgi:hypothetical protein
MKLLYSTAGSADELADLPDKINLAGAAFSLTGEVFLGDAFLIAALLNLDVVLAAAVAAAFFCCAHQAF